MAERQEGVDFLGGPYHGEHQMMTKTQIVGQVIFVPLTSLSVFDPDDELAMASSVRVGKYVVEEWVFEGTNDKGYYHAERFWVADWKGER
jgi:hypothetical protein